MKKVGKAFKCNYKKLGSKDDAFTRWPKSKQRHAHLVAKEDDGPSTMCFPTFPNWWPRVSVF